MKQNEFQELMARFGLRAGGDLALGAWKGWPVKVKREQVYGICNIQAEFALSGRVDKEHAKAIAQEVKAYKNCSAILGLSAVVVVPDKPKLGSFTERFTAVMDLVVQGLAEAGVKPPVVCPLCKGGGCDSMALLNDSYVPTHRTCVTSSVQGTLEKAEQENTGNYLTGLIGALLGGLVGTLPNILAAVFLERVIAVLYALIPIFAYYGYKLFKGKMNKGAFVCALLSSAVNLFIMQYLYVYVIFVQRLGGMLSPGDALYYYMDMLTGGNLTADLAQSALFLGLGLWISWGVITRTAKQDIHQAAAVASTLQPLPGVAAPTSSEES